MDPDGREIVGTDGQAIKNSDSKIIATIENHCLGKF